MTTSAAPAVQTRPEEGTAPLILSSVDPINRRVDATTPANAHNGILGTFRLIDGWREGADKLDSVRSWLDDLRGDKAMWVFLWSEAEAKHAERVFARFVSVFGT